MSNVLARRVASTPVRTATQTWTKIMELIAPDPESSARKQLVAATGVACASISAEATKEEAFVVWGGGPRVRIYTIFDEDAITQDDVNEDPLLKSPTEGDWHLSIPCHPDDVAWSQKQLASGSNRITARSMDEDVDDDAGDSERATAMSINLGEFMKP